MDLLRNSKYQCADFQLDAGDLVVLVTDGFTEVENAESDLFGDQRLEEFASLAISADQIFTAVCQFLNCWRSHSVQNGLK